MKTNSRTRHLVHIWLPGTLAFVCALLTPCKRSSLTAQITLEGVRAVPAGEPEDLRRRVAALRQHVRQAEADLMRFDETSHRLDREIAELLRRIAALESRPPESPQEYRKPGLRAVYFDFPKPMRVNLKPQRLAIVCENNTVTIADSASVMRAVDRIELNRIVKEVKDKGGQQEHTWSASAGHFDLKFVARHENERTAVGLQLARKAGGRHRGEDPSAMALPDSEFSRKVANADPQTTLVQIAVYHDSYDVFEKVRNILTQKQFDVYWVPWPADELVGIGAGTGISPGW